MTLLYLYALLAADDEPREAGRGVAGEPVRAVRAGDFAAAAGAVDAPPPVELASLRAHDAVVRRLADRARAILPLRFGQLVADEAALGESVERARPRLVESLARVAGCEQVTWRVFGVRDDDHAHEHEHAPDAAGDAGPGTRYLAALRARRRALATPPPQIADALAAVAPLVRAERVERHDAGELIASVHQLVRRADREAYARRVAAALESVRGARVRVGAPAPPYAFAGGWTE